MISGPRRRGRECALQLLYQMEGASPRPQGHADPAALDVDERLRSYWAHFGEPDAPAAESEQWRAFAETLVRGVCADLTAIDALLGQASQHWRLERMSRVDRSILRIAVYELRHEPEVPTSVVLDEAIEIAKRFGTEESPAFVNGVLDRVARDVRGAQ